MQHHQQILMDQKTNQMKNRILFLITNQLYQNDSNGVENAENATSPPLATDVNGSKNKSDEKSNIVLANTSAVAKNNSNAVEALKQTEKLFLNTTKK